MGRGPPPATSLQEACLEASPAASQDPIAPQAGVYWRRDRRRFYIQFKDVEGRWTSRAAGTEREAAEALLAEVKRGVELLRRGRSLPGETPGGSSSAPGTLADLSDAWLARRAERGLRDTRHDRAHLEHHILPRIGHLDVSAVRVADVRGLIEELEIAGLAPRTIRKVYGTLQVYFRDLVRAEVIDRSPCVLGKGDLPANIDKDPSWRPGAVFARLGGRAPSRAGQRPRGPAGSLRAALPHGRPGGRSGGSQVVQPRPRGGASGAALDRTVL